MHSTPTIAACFARNTHVIRSETPLAGGTEAGRRRDGCGKDGRRRAYFVLVGMCALWVGAWGWLLHAG